MWPGSAEPLFYQRDRDTKPAEFLPPFFLAGYDPPTRLVGCLLWPEEGAQGGVWQPTLLAARQGEGSQLIVTQINAYIRTQGINCAVSNLVLNPVIAWLGNRQMEFVPLRGDNSIVADTAVTCIVLSLLVALFMAAGVRRELLAGSLEITAGSPRGGRVLSLLPRQAWALGLLLGVGVACVLTPLTFWLFHAFGFSGLAFGWFALFKAIYTPVMGYIIARWVILRQLPG
jgi:hypothetical protein